MILEGITFSDEAGGFAILEGRGRGQPDDPFVIVEEIFDERVPAILTIRGLGRAAERLTVAGAAAGFTLVKIVRNATPLTWTSFELELREVRTRSSPYEDGLSFAQALGPQRLYRSDRFTAAFQTDEPRDVLTFHGGVVRPGETVTVELAITDYSPIFEFYLVQRQLAPVAAIHGLPFD
ncbi:hypothetical protein HRbin40_00643 [bacterium HR40]|nr:hypothetical protein HRbin40_00643 [bacterium HR40]